MDLIVIFKQLKESYPEQYAPEIVAACTEYELEDGAGEFMDEKEAEAKADPFNVGVRRLRMKFPDSFRKEVRQLLVGEFSTETKCLGVEPEDANGSRP